jgi:hypothetical protein
VRSNGEVERGSLREKISAGTVPSMPLTSYANSKHVAGYGVRVFIIECASGSLWEVGYIRDL